MILPTKHPANRDAIGADVPSSGPIASVPSWIRRAVSDTESLLTEDVEDVALTAGAAIGTLDAIVRRQARSAGAWRQRLALSAAAVTAMQAGRVEDESALRDAVLLTRPGDNVGPAGRMSMAWRRLAALPAEKLLTEASIGAVLYDFGLARNDDGVRDLTHNVRQLANDEGTVGMLTGAIAIAERYGFGRNLGAWLADALLAKRLDWAYAIPLLGTETALDLGARPRRSAANSMAASVETAPERAKGLLAAQMRSALRAIDLSVELERRANRLLAVAPKLRAKAASSVVEQLLFEDATTASQPIAGMSDRGLRRLFDRLVDLGAIRELSGRPTFRIYGL